MIRVPMGVDQLSDRVSAQIVERCFEPDSRYRESGIYKKFPVLAGEDSDVSSRALQNGDVAANRMRFDLGFGRCIDHGWDNTLRFREEHTRSETNSGSTETSCCDEASAS